MEIRSNVLHFGDALSLLERLEDNRFDLIYLDPPWNSRVIDNPKESTKYVEFIFQIIQQVHRCLNQKGNLFLHIPSSIEEINFRRIVESIFGDENFHIEFILPQPANYSYSSQPIVGRNHNLLLLFSKTSPSRTYILKNEAGRAEVLKRYNRQDEKGKYITTSLLTTNYRSNLQFEWQGFIPPEGRSWRYNPEKLDQLLEEGMIDFNRFNTRPMLKRYFSEDSLPLVGTIWDDIKVSDWNWGRKHIPSQSTHFFNRILRLGSQEGDWVLDPFAGAGGLLVEANNLNRNWVGCELDDVKGILTERLIGESVDYQVGEFGENTPIIWNNYQQWTETREKWLEKQIQLGQSQRLAFIELTGIHSPQSPIEAKVEKDIHGIIQTIAGFLNSRFGGNILIGVSKDGGIQGIEGANWRIRKRNEGGINILDQIDQLFGVEARNCCSLDFIKLGSATIGILKVAPTKIPIFWDGKFFLRRESSTEDLKGPETINYLIRQRIGSKEEQLQQAVKNGESQYLEFKKELTGTGKGKSKPTKKVLREIVGFLNSEFNGVLLIGVNDDGTIHGIEEDLKRADPQKKNEDGYDLYLRNHIAASIGPTVGKFIDIHFTQIQKKRICKVYIRPSPDPVFWEEKYILRIGSQAKQIPISEAWSHYSKKKILFHS